MDGRPTPRGRNWGANGGQRRRGALDKPRGLDFFAATVGASGGGMGGDFLAVY